MTLELHRLRFQFEAAQRLRFGPLAANTLRGALGTELSAVVGAELYGRIFRPVQRESGPSGFAHLPRPFVLRTHHLDCADLLPGDIFEITLHVFDPTEDVLAAFAQAFARLEQTGLGDSRTPVRLLGWTSTPISLSLVAGEAPITAARLELITATELKAAHPWHTNPDFATLACRVRDRLSLLRQVYGAGPLGIDFRAFAQRAGEVNLIRASLHPREVFRKSTRTGQRHSLGGVVGEIGYSGPLTEFLPYLEAARWTGVGRHTVWGNGELIVQPLAGQP